MAVRREGAQSGSRKKRRTPPSQGHPSQGRPTVGGGTKSAPKVYRTPPAPAPKGGHPSRGRPTVSGGTGGRKPKRYKSSTPSVKKQRRQAAKERRHLQRLYLRARGSKAAHPTISEVERRELNEQSLSGPDNIVGGRDFGRKRDIKSGPRYPLTTRESRQRRRKYGGLTERSQESVNKTVAPALKALEVTTRPAKVVGNTIAGDRVDRAVVKGAKGKGKYPGEALGLHGVAGFAADVALDPTTYVSGGASVPAKAAAKKAARKTYRREIKKTATVSAEKGTVKKAARKAARRAVRRGQAATPAASRARAQAVERAAARKVHVRAKRKANRAGRKAAEGMPENKGINIGVGRHRTTGKTTARIVRKLRRGKEARRTRELGTTLSPHVRPAGVKHAEFETLKAAEREARAGTTRGKFRAVHLARGLKDALPEKDYERVINAVERGTVYDLPEKLRGPARKIEQAFNRARKAERKAGIDTPQSRIGYFSHQLKETLESPPKVKGGKPGRTLNPGYTKQRKFQGTLAQIREQGGPDFSTNAPLVLANRLAASASDTAKARLNQAIIKAGRPVEAGMKLSDDEAVAVIKGKNLQFADHRLEQSIVDGKAPTDARYVVVNKSFVNRLTRGTAPSENLVVDNPILRGYDKVQGGFKFTATYVNPGFHFRNLYGDTQNAYLAQALPSLAANMGRSARVLHRLDKQEEALLKLDKKTGRPGTIKVRDEFGKKTQMDVDSLAREAESAGAIRQGFLGRELPELLRSGESKVGKLGKGKATSRPRRAGRFGKRLIQNREDLVRLATYIGGRRQGLTAREAANRVAKYHFDYGDLSPFEREVLRRFFPFYTFTARNIPLQAKSLLAKPGKYANFEKARQHVAMAFDVDQDEFEERLREFQKRATPFPVEIDGNMFAVSTAFPLQDLNQLPWQVLASPGFAGLADFGDESMKKAMSMLTPLIRTPVELYANYSFFFRGPIERDDSPLVAAPGFVGAFPGFAKDALGIVRGIDRRSGKKVWMWPGKVDYSAKVLPGPTNFAQQAATNAQNRRGQGLGGKALSYGLGIKADQVDPQTAKIDSLFEEKTQLEKKRSALRQQGIGSKDYGRKETPEYRKLRDRLKAIDNQITGLSKQRGDKVPLLEVPRKKKPGFFDEPGEGSKSKFFDDVRPKESESFFGGVK